MVYFFTVTAPVVAASSAAALADAGSNTPNTESYTVYMGKNQSENELLIKYGK